MREAFVPRKFSPSSLEKIEQAVEIIADYQAQGFTLTLRQLYYQFVSRDLIPNTMQSYKVLGSVINDARLAGLIDWDAIEDRTRNLRQNSHWDSPADLMEDAAEQFAFDKWADQPNHVEVWIEKDALIGVIEGVCRKNDVGYFACRGYASQSELYSAGKRFAEKLERGQQVVVLHLGDHDPSGVDMTRDNEDRLNMFARNEVEVRRLALNIDQVRRYRPPPNPAKITDSRATAYIRDYGRQSWELDALTPTVIASLIEKQIHGLRDPDVWADAVEREKQAKARFEAYAAELRREQDGY